MILSSTLLRSNISDDLKSDSSIESEYNLDRDNSEISNINPRLNHDIRKVKNDETVNDLLDKLNITDEIRSEANDLSSVKEEIIFNKDLLNVLNSPKSKLRSYYSNSSVNSIKKISDKKKSSNSLENINSKQKDESNQKNIEIINITSLFDSDTYLKNNKNFISKESLFCNEKVKDKENCSRNDENHHLNACLDLKPLIKTNNNNYIPELFDSKLNINIESYQYLSANCTSNENNRLTNISNSKTQKNNSLDYIPIHQYNRYITNNIVSNEINSIPFTKSSSYTNNQVKFSHNIVSDFKIMNYSDLSLDQVINIYHFMSKDKYGCRNLQTRIDENPSIIKIFISLKFYDFFLDLIKDPFGNYFIQNVVQYMDDNLLETFINQLSPYLTEVGNNQHGTRVVQKIIELLRTDEIIDLFMQKIQNSISSYIFNINGNHIVIKLLAQISCEKACFIYECILNNIVLIASDKFGCVVVQKCLSSLPNLSNIKTSILHNIVKHCKMLILDIYGNYVLQKIIEQNDHQINQALAKVYENDLVNLSRHKVASNVIEKVLYILRKLLDYSSDETKKMMISRISSSKVIALLLFDKFGNYVLQKALQVSKEKNLYILINLLSQYMDKLRKLQSGQKLYEKLVEAYPELKKKRIKYK